MRRSSSMNYSRHALPRFALRLSENDSCFVVLPSSPVHRGQRAPYRCRPRSTCFHHKQIESDTTSHVNRDRLPPQLNTHEKVKGFHHERTGA
jgi:hypothetical protein